MRALVFRGPWDLVVEERSDPEPGPGEVSVSILATGICGSDLHGYTGENGRRFPGQVMGHETVGRVATVGAGVEEVTPGTLVTVEPVIACGRCAACRSGRDHRCPDRTIVGVAPGVSSAFADLLVVPAANAVPLPDSMPYEYGALIEPLSVGYHAARRGGCSADDAVLVVGGGPIGQACTLAARRLGATKIAVSEPQEGRRGLLERIGATTVDPTSTDLAQAAREILGQEPTLVLDAVGSSRSLADGFGASVMGATVVLVGMNEPQVQLPAYAVSIEERTLVGSYCYPFAHFRETAQWVASAPPELAHLVEGRVGWDGAAEAFRSLAAGENPASKILVLPGG